MTLHQTLSASSQGYGQVQLAIRTMLRPNDECVATNQVKETLPYVDRLLFAFNLQQ